MALNDKYAVHSQKMRAVMSLLCSAFACSVIILLAAGPASVFAREELKPGGKRLVLNPMASTKPDETHAALVVSQRDFSDVVFSADFETIEQLRQNTPPNAWESAWAVFHYANNTQFYYVSFKPNGWELGKADAAYPGAQRYLATGSDMPSPVGTVHRFEIRTNGPQITVSLDGKLLTTFTDSERPYLSGKIGFYSEDAKVGFDNVTGSVTENFDSYGTRSLGDNEAIGDAWTAAFVGFGSAAIEPYEPGPSPTATPPAPKAAPAPAPSQTRSPARAPRRGRSSGRPSPV